MNIGKSKKSSHFPIVLAALALLIGVYFYVIKDVKPNLSSDNSQTDIDKPTSVYRGYNFADIIRDNINMVHSDSIFSIYLNRSLNGPFLMYVYRDSLNTRRLKDRFYVHAYLKDSLSASENGKKKFANLDFYAPPEQLKVDGVKYFVFKGSLQHERFGLSDISHINTGRFKSGVGRLDQVERIIVSGLSEIKISDKLANLELVIKENDFKKVAQKRIEALETGILATTEDDLIKAKVSYNNEPKIDAEIRLKGDWTDHLDDAAKWSFRVITDGLHTVNGTRKFSIQHPKVRNYLWEWLFNKTMKDNDIIGLRYDFVNASIKLTKKSVITDTVNLGIMAFEEAFDKILIENNKRREGLILGFDESLIWGDRQQQYTLHLNEDARANQLQSIVNAPVKVYNQNKVLADPKLTKQFNIAKDLLDGVRGGQIKISEAFDIDKLTTFVALTNLLGGKHGLITHNLRIYYNPITNKLEPISFDSNSGKRLTEIIHYPFSKNDDFYSEKLVEKLTYFASEEFVNDLVKGSFYELSELSSNLNAEFKTNLDLSIIEYNSNFIKKKINPSTVIVSGLLELGDDNVEVEISNFSDFPVAIERLVHVKGRSLSESVSNTIIYPKEKEIVVFKLKEAFQNAFVSKKNKKGGFRYPKDIEKLQVSHGILGRSETRADPIFAYGKNPKISESLKRYSNSFKSNLSDFEFLLIDEDKKEITFKKGKHKLVKTLIIPSGNNVIVEAGMQLDLANEASIISYSHLTMIGAENSPIKFYSSDGTGRGIFVTNTNTKSILDYVHFVNLANPTSTIWEVSGAVNFHEADVEIHNSIFSNNRCEDGLNIIRSKFSINSSSFENTLSDAFDGDFVVGSISDSKFFNTGNDGIDISGSELRLENIEIQNPSDKGISAGEDSSISGKNVKIIGGEIGIVSKDLSRIELAGVSIFGTKLGFSAFQKKSEFGIGEIHISDLTLEGNTLDYLIETKSKLTINQVPVETVSNRVIDQMYGNEYGKSTR